MVPLLVVSVTCGSGTTAESEARNPPPLSLTRMLNSPMLPTRQVKVWLNSVPPASLVRLVQTLSTVIARPPWSRAWPLTLTVITRP